MQKLREVLAALWLLCVWTAASYFVGVLPIWAATTPNSNIMAQTPLTKCIQFLQGTDNANTYKTLITGGSNGSVIMGMWSTSFDPSASHVLTVQISSSTSAHCSPATSCFGGSSVTQATGSATLGSTPTNLMSPTNWPGLPVDNNGNPFFYLTDNTFTIEVTFATALTSSDWINVCVTYANF